MGNRPSLSLAQRLELVERLRAPAAVGAVVGGAVSEALAPVRSDVLRTLTLDANALVSLLRCLQRPRLAREPSSITRALPSCIAGWQE